MELIQRRLLFLTLHYQMI